MKIEQDKIKKYGEWAIITGASSGIGKQFAVQLSQSGVNTVLIARRNDLLQNLSADIKNIYNTETIIICGDLTLESTIIELKEKTKNLEIGILINNAGFGYIGNFEDGDLTNYKKMIELNCLIPTELTFHFIKGMKTRNRGAVIFLGSTLSFIPAPFVSLYSATKSFNTSLGYTLWKELKESNIDVLSINPGGTKTEFERISNDNLFTRDPENVVVTALNNLGKKPSVIDGFINKTMVLLSKIIPQKMLLNITGNFVIKNIRKKK